MNTESVFKAMADETRLRLIHLALHHELNVNEIVSILEMGQSRISRHLKILAESGLLKPRRDGLWTFYRASQTGKAHQFLQAASFVFESREIYAQDLARAATALEERSRETQRFFDAIAGDWDRMKTDIIGETPLASLIAEELAGVGTAADLGCGSGDLLHAVLHTCRHAIGVEKSPRMLDMARRRFSPDDLSHRVDLRIGALEHLPLRPGEADGAVVNMVLHHLPEPEKALREIHRVLKRNNRLIIIDLERHSLEDMRRRFGDRWLGFDETELTATLNECGFKVKKIRHFHLKMDLKGFIITSIRK